MNGCFSCGISVCIDTSVKLFVFLFVCGVYLSAGSLIDTMSDLQSSAIRSTNASSNVTEDQFFYLIRFETKTCKAKQEEIIKMVSSYFKDRGNTAAVQSGPDSQNNSSWCLNVFGCAATSYNKNSARRAMKRILERCACGNVSIFINPSGSSRSHVLNQSVGQDPSVESKNLPGVTTFAAALASGTNSGKQDSGDQQDPTRLLLHQVLALRIMLTRFFRSHGPGYADQRQQSKTDPNTASSLPDHIFLECKRPKTPYPLPSSGISGLPQR